MANREALRELQKRLASRLQAARSEGVSASWLAVKADGAHYLFPLAQSGEIFSLANLQPVPYAKSWFKGVVNLRGGLYGVVDLAGFIGNWSQPPKRTEQMLAEASVVTLNAGMEVNCALLVDSLAGLRNADAFTGSEPPPDDSPPYFGNRFSDAQGQVWQEINLRSLSQLPVFLGISA